MPNSALCVGLTYGDATPCALADASGMTNVASALGAGTVTLLTDVDSDVPVAREGVLASLQEMVANAEPGDTVLFSFSGMAGEGNGIALPDGTVISDVDLQTVLAELPAGANCALIMDAPVEFDFSAMGEGVGNIITMSAAAEGQYNFAGEDGGMSPFSAAVMEVMTNPDNAGISWTDAAARVQETMGPDMPEMVLNSSNPEALFEPAVPVEEAVVVDGTVVEVEVVEEPVVEEEETTEVEVEEVPVVDKCCAEPEPVIDDCCC
ncbi:hypothetical protein H9P43_003055 [Blastocladiella emersonii ATCC 22665]|nr:hypothetical protein H9P43_003055 [Blastocladiella emersonii ATCC 22665]